VKFEQAGEERSITLAASDAGAPPASPLVRVPDRHHPWQSRAPGAALLLRAARNSRHRRQLRKRTRRLTHPPPPPYKPWVPARAKLNHTGDCSPDFPPITQSWFGWSRARHSLQVAVPFPSSVIRSAQDRIPGSGLIWGRKGPECPDEPLVGTAIRGLTFIPE